ncbi:Integrase catalytic core, partial [Arabidopsis thaliana x Arabidopsis arenosa]
MTCEILNVDKDWVLWNGAIGEEMDSLIKNGTWILVDRPKDRKVIGCRWLFKIKPGIPGVESKRHKARLVARGFTQKEGIDYQEIFAPVVKHTSIRILMSVVVNKDLELEQMDVKTAFLHGDLEEELYMEQPEGVVSVGNEDKDDSERIDTEKTPYSSDVGSMMYAMIGTQPDLAYGIGLGELLRYIKRSQDLSLVYTKGKDLSVVGYCDSDHGGDLDRKRSTSGYVFTVGGNTISWKSCLQPVMALSSTEAEFIALTEAVKEAIWVKGLLGDLGFVQDNAQVWCDSQSAICLSKNSVFHERTKHMALKRSFLSEIKEEEWYQSPRFLRVMANDAGTTTIMKASFQVFNENSDFSLWKTRMKAHLGLAGLKGIVDDFSLTKTVPLTKAEGKKVEEGDDVTESSQTKEVQDLDKIEKSEQAMNRIIAHVGDAVLRKIDHCKTAAEMWETLNKLYMETSLPNRIYVQLKFYSFKMSDSKTINENVNEFLKIVAELSSLEIVVGEEVRAILFLNGLSSRYSQLKHTLKYGNKALLLQDVISSAKSLERELDELQELEKSPSTVLYTTERGRQPVKNNQKNGQGRGRSRSNSKTRLTCWFCKKEGHVKKDCFARKKKMESEEQGEAGVITEKLVFSEALSVNDQLVKDLWVLDSGCTSHMTSRRDWFCNFQENGSTTILLGDDHSVESQGQGSIRINTHGGSIKVLNNVKLGHMSLNNLKVLAGKGLLNGKEIKELDFCEHCVMGKSKRLSFNVGKHDAVDALSYVHADLWGSSNLSPSLSGKQYFLSIIDDKTRKVWLYFLKTKDETFEKFCEWKELVENQVDRKVKCLRTDNGLEFCNTRFDSYCKTHGIERHRTCTYTPQQNGVAERMNRTIMEKVRCLLNESGLDESFWAEAAATAAYIINRSPASAIDHNVPEELWLNKKPGYKHLKRFGSLAFVHHDQGKLKPRALKGVFLGYPAGTKGYKIWLLDEEKCVISRNVVFQEDTVYKDFKRKISEAEKNDSETITPNSEDITELVKEQVSSKQGGVITEQEEISDDESNEETGDTEIVQSPARAGLTNYQLERDRPRRKIVAPVKMKDYTQFAFALMTCEILNVEEEPQCLHDAQKDKDWVLWNGAIGEEIDSLIKN